MKHLFLTTSVLATCLASATQAGVIEERKAKSRKMSPSYALFRHKSVRAILKPLLLVGEILLTGPLRCQTFS